MRRVSYRGIATGTAGYQDSRSDRSGQRRSAISLQCFALLNIGALLIVSFVAFLSATQPSDANLPLPKPSSNMLRGNVDLEASVRTSLIAVESMSPIQRTVADRTLPLEPPASKSKVTRAVEDAPVRSHATDGSASVSSPTTYVNTNTSAGANLQRRFLVEFRVAVGRPIPSSEVASFTVEVLPEWAPIGAAHLKKLVEAKYFDGCSFFRVLPKFMAQFGLSPDPATTKAWARRLIKDDPVVASNARGTVTFAMRGKHTRTTQLFVNFVNNARLDKEGFAPIGRVVGGGMVVVDRINTAHRERPSQGKIHSRGREYLKAEFPDLSYILTARVVSPSSPTQQQQQQEDATPVEPVTLAGGKKATPPPPPGLVVLGMHRSGTSLLGGLLFRCGFFVGAKRDLIWGADPNDNKKGFFERTDVVLQNDWLLKQQRVHWSLYTDRFKPEEAATVVSAALATRGAGQGSEAFRGDAEENWRRYGAKGLKALQVAALGSQPWALKDPRLCLTLPFWMPLLSSSAMAAKSSLSPFTSTVVRPGADPSAAGTAPALLFTYRHPVEVAKSLQKREGFLLKRALLLWLSYNQQALVYSSSGSAGSGAAAEARARPPCRVVTSNARLTASPLREVKRLTASLRERCGLKVPRDIAAAEVEEFVDPALQRNHALSPSSSSGQPCDPGASWESFQLVNDPKHNPTAAVTPKQRRVLRMALEAFCAMENGTVFAAEEIPGGRLALTETAQFQRFYNEPLPWG